MNQEDRERVGLAPGTVVDGRYTIEHELGRGGYARVYRAAHADLARAAALKVIELPDRPGAVDPFIDRFLQEARIAANLSHPNVVTVYEYGVIEATGQPYLAMELLEGWDLEMVLSHHGPIAPERAVRLMVEVLDALAEAQGKGIVHKDLKPSNLFMVGEGTLRERLVLIDFGIARVWDDDDSRITQTGGFTGTPAYFAPEYVESQIVTPAIDVYQCALILVEMMTSVPAVIAENSMQYLLKHCAGEVDVPEELRSSPLGPILDRALATDHTARYPDCATFRDALAAVDASVIPPPRAPTPGPLVRSSTLETTPETDEFAESIISGDTLAAPEPAAPSVPADPAESPPRTDDSGDRDQARPVAPIVPVIAGIALIAALAVAAAFVHEDPAQPVYTEPTISAEPQATAIVAPSDVPIPQPDLAPEVVEPQQPPADAGLVPDRPSEQPAARRPATIATVPPNAVLAIDGVRYGQTPVEVAGELLGGETHRITLHRVGYKTHRAEVTFRPGEELSFELERKRRPRKQKIHKVQKRQRRNDSPDPIDVAP